MTNYYKHKQKGELGAECELMAKLQGLSIKNSVSLFSDSVIHSLSVTILIFLEDN